LSPSDEFAGSSTLTESSLAVVLGPPAGAAEQTSEGLSASAAIGGGSAGLAALAALLLLLLFRKKKPKLEPQPESEIGTTNSIDERDEYVSEYGLSDAVRSCDADEDDEDLPRVPEGTNSSAGGDSHVSEHNPEEFEGLDGAPDET
jgi:hypothetical protein